MRFSALSELVGTARDMITSLALYTANPDFRQYVNRVHELAEFVHYIYVRPSDMDLIKQSYRFRETPLTCATAIWKERL